MQGSEEMLADLELQRWGRDCLLALAQDSPENARRLCEVGAKEHVKVLMKSEALKQSETKDDDMRQLRHLLHLLREQHDPLVLQLTRRVAARV